MVKKLVITPGGPRPSGMVHEVRSGQVVYPDQNGGYIVAEQLVLDDQNPAIQSENSSSVRQNED